MKNSFIYLIENLIENKNLKLSNLNILDKENFNKII
jgi:hypothetical protein